MQAHEVALGREETDACNAIADLCRAALQDIAQLRQGDASASKLSQAQAEAQVQDKFRRTRHYLNELKFMAEEQDT
jgi:hypothetical protein